jgi:hypothetical protein
MKEKVMLPKEVAEAIEFMRKRWDDKAIVQWSNYTETARKCRPELAIIQDYFGFPAQFDRFNELMDALVNGYQIEQTPEEEVLEKYRSHAEIVNFYAGKSLDISEWKQQRYSSGYIAGVKDFATSYKIQFKGLNT